ncbi:HD-GYP domain-containing protein [Paenibacillus sp. GCM10027628]|uniref:HD-GYP domain-containing protein n=1 Tax=Paenibacillus sp. GCM10027628 TaxID=3273413 RepID=UPI00362B3AF0
MTTKSNIYDIVQRYALFEAIGLGILFLSTLMVCIWQIRRLRSLRARGDRANLLLEHVQAARGIETNIDYLLERIGTLIDAPVYAFYIFDAKNKQYVLKGVRHSDTDFGKVRPSYSGLAAYKKEAYMPPISLNTVSIPSMPQTVDEGEVPLFIVPLGGIGAVRIGPVRKVSGKTVKAIDELAKQIQYVLPELILSENMRNQVDVVVASGKALQNISDVAIDPRSTLDLMIKASLKAIGAFGAIYLEKLPTRWQIATAIGLASDVRMELSRDESFHQYIRSQVEGRESVVIGQGEAAFYELPSIIAAQGTQAIAITQIGHHGLLVFLFQNSVSLDINSYSMIAYDLKEIVEAQAPIQHLSKVYIQILKKLARMMDNLNPYTIGYSDQMSRYSIIIAKELGLPDDEIRDIALAAYLSNIGVLGLSADLYQKEGKYTEAEYEMMKLHSEVGASIISITTGNKRVASYIMSHHERMDGAGYPAGLRGAEIPTGARILAVVQTFLAKINGRKQRDPLTFDKALQMLVSATGTQLDKQVVDALVQWYQRKRLDPQFNDRSLGNCWEMCCVPSSICEHCPVYMSSSSGSRKNCWEVEGNLCSSHGKSCASCFVRTEFMTRSAVIR